MAGRWRISHKLMLGLGLVIVVMGVLLAGTVEGFYSCNTSMKAVDSKLTELKAAQQFKQAIIELARVDSDEPLRVQRDLLQQHLRHAAATLSAYRSQFEETCRRRRLLRKDHHTPGFLQDVETKIVGLARILDEIVAEANLVLNGEDGPPLRRHKEIDPVILSLVGDADDLEEGIYEELFYIKTEAYSDTTFSFWFVGSTNVLSLVLMVGMLRVPYNWMFHPVRDLMQGVSRLAQGDFEHPIKVTSGDEMEELAAAFNDMTGRLREMYRDLARQVNERSRQLVRSERLASVGFLAAGVAHEINNPLASIAFCSEALEARLSEVLQKAVRLNGRGGDAEVILKYLKMIQQEAFRCKEITQKLLDFSRSNERRREPTDLNQLVESVLDVTQHLQPHKDKQIRFDAPAKVQASVNAQEIQSVVLNLVVNALESMGEGGTLSVSLKARDGQAELMFHDTGCGMTGEVLENIFEPFFTQSRSGKGTDLGLTISHRIITGHGGDIEACSPGPGQGSTFTVRLPLQPVGDGNGKEQEGEAGNPELLFRQRQAA